ncbi:predicted protein [Ostreococcus lucimarinus CCE9901]|uniref:CBS domain-containing protein n=1 Tax=Ostreococcus lucimarinus (strain CCE9901) TaxID=436017 RepID=A4SAE3_OSTLU|nr:predicted protein [Ostreococcus lucimarinus CCE9901]ABP00738.1 predicted protein [Ostreococcus lucimarinus CCE9901]|eukprot:XP_001422421.1 predicted protein [Ostreococcus lucimarinus CCE9901]
MVPTCRDFMTPARACITATTDDTIESVVHALAYDGVGCVCVLDAGKPVGVVTKADALEWWLEKLPMDCACGAVANKAVIQASPWMTRDEVSAVLMRNRVHHVAVTDRDGVFVGLVSAWDIAREVGRAYELPFWQEFFERVRQPRLRGSRPTRSSAPAA